MPENPPAVEKEDGNNDVVDATPASKGDVAAQGEEVFRYGIEKEGKHDSDVYGSHSVVSERVSVFRRMMKSRSGTQEEVQMFLNIHKVEFVTSPMRGRLIDPSCAHEKQRYPCQVMILDDFGATLPCRARRWQRRKSECRWQQVGSKFPVAGSHKIGGRMLQYESSQQRVKTKEW